MGSANDGLKSAYELAMERLAQKDGGLKVLTDEQKRAIAEVGQKAKARVAEIEIMYRQKLAEAGDDAEKLAKFEEQKAAEIARARSAEERDKEKIRAG